MTSKRFLFWRLLESKIDQHPLRKDVQHSSKNRVPKNSKKLQKGLKNELTFATVLVLLPSFLSPGPPFGAQGEPQGCPEPPKSSFWWFLIDFAWNLQLQRFFQLFKVGGMRRKPLKFHEPKPSNTIPGSHAQVFDKSAPQCFGGWVKKWWGNMNGPEASWSSSSGPGAAAAVALEHPGAAAGVLEQQECCGMRSQFASRSQRSVAISVWLQPWLILRFQPAEGLVRPQRLHPQRWLRNY